MSAEPDPDDIAERGGDGRRGHGRASESEPARRQQHGSAHDSQARKPGADGESRYSGSLRASGSRNGSERGAAAGGRRRSQPFAGRDRSENEPRRPYPRKTDRRTDAKGKQGPGSRPEREPDAAFSGRTSTDIARPDLPDDVDVNALDPEVRKELRTLPKGLADLVGSHLVAAGHVLDDDPQLALAHARFARSRAGRVAAVREAAGLAAYHAGEWSESLAELRAARRLSGGPGHLALLADCERALGRPERALEIARSAEARQLDTEEAIELRIVAAGARRDLGQLDAAVVALQGPDLTGGDPQPWRARLRYAYADNLSAAGREQEAIRWFLAAAEADPDNLTDAAERAAELSNRAAGAE